MDYFDIDLELTEKDLALKEAAHRFAKEVMRPVAKELDAMSAEDYIADSGYMAMGKVLTTMSPAGVVQKVIASGLRGRGGGGDRRAGVLRDVESGTDLRHGSVIHHLRVAGALSAGQCLSWTFLPHHVGARS